MGTRRNIGPSLVPRQASPAAYSSTDISAKGVASDPFSTTCSAQASAGTYLSTYPSTWSSPATYVVASVRPISAAHTEQPLFFVGWASGSLSFCSGAICGPLFPMFGDSGVLAWSATSQRSGGIWRCHGVPPSATTPRSATEPCPWPGSLFGSLLPESSSRKEPGRHRGSLKDWGRLGTPARVSVELSAFRAWPRHATAPPCPSAKPILREANDSLADAPSTPQPSRASSLHPMLCTTFRSYLGHVPPCWAELPAT